MVRDLGHSPVFMILAIGLACLSEFYLYLQIRVNFEREFKKKESSTELDKLIELIIDSYTKNNPRITSSLLSIGP